MRKYIFVTLLSIVMVLPVIVLAGDIPVGEPVTLSSLEEIIRMLAIFFIRLSGIIAAIILVLTGIWMMKARDEASYKQAKDWFWRGIKGALVIFGVGVILNTIRGVWSREFFDGWFFF